MKFFYLLLLVALPSVILAQSNYHAGYIVKADGDTVKGFINYREWDRSPKKVDFKLTMDNAKPTVYGAAFIKGFGVYGFERYVSYLGAITMGPIDVSKLPSDIDTTKMVDTVFLRQVTTGKYITLYSYKDDIKNRLFLAEPGGRPSELIYYAYLGDNNTIVGSHQYKGQLLLFINKSPMEDKQIIDEVNRIEYTQSDIEKLADHINGVSQKNGVNNRFFWGIGLNTTTAEETLTKYNTYEPERSTSLAPMISWGVDFFSNPQVQHLIFRVEVSASYVTAKFNDRGASSNSVFEYNQYNGTITPQILLNLYNKDNFKVYIDAGWAFNFSAYSNNQFFTKYNDPTLGTTTPVKDFYKLEPYWSNFPFQAGVVLKKRLEFFASYSPGAAYTKYTQIYASNRSVDLGVKLLMGK